MFRSQNKWLRTCPVQVRIDLFAGSTHNSGANNDSSITIFHKIIFFLDVNKWICIGIDVNFTIPAKQFFFRQDTITISGIV